MQQAKPIWQSKTLWINLIAIIALVLQTYTSFIIDPDKQIVILGVINTLLRFITKVPIEWGGSSDQAGFITISVSFLITVSLLFSLLLFAGCATTGTPVAQDSPQVIAGKSLLAVKSTIVTAAQATDGLCKVGTLKPNICAQAKAAYKLAKPAYDTAVDAYLLMVQGGDPAAFTDALQRVQGIAVNLTLLTGGAH